MRLHYNYDNYHNYPSLVITFGGESGAQVEISGENGQALIEQSSGLHLLEVNGADLGSIGGKEKWSWMEYLCVVLGFIFFLNFTHIAHYCLLTDPVKPGLFYNHLRY